MSRLKGERVSNIRIVDRRCLREGELPVVQPQHPARPAGRRRVRRRTRVLPLLPRPQPVHDGAGRADDRASGPRVSFQPRGRSLAAEARGLRRAARQEPTLGGRRRDRAAAAPGAALAVWRRRTEPSGRRCCFRAPGDSAPSSSRRASRARGRPRRPSTSRSCSTQLGKAGPAGRRRPPSSSPPRRLPRVEQGRARLDPRRGRRAVPRDSEDRHLRRLPRARRADARRIPRDCFPPRA